MTIRESKIIRMDYVGGFNIIFNILNLNNPWATSDTQKYLGCGEGGLLTDKCQLTNVEEITGLEITFLQTQIYLFRQGSKQMPKHGMMLFEKRIFTCSQSIQPCVTVLIGKMVPLIQERSGRHHRYEVSQPSIPTT